MEKQRFKQKEKHDYTNRRRGKSAKRTRSSTVSLVRLIFFASRYIGQEKAVALPDTIRFPKLDTILLLFVII